MIIKKIKLYFFVIVILSITGLLCLELLSRIYLQYSTGSYRISHQPIEDQSPLSNVKIRDSIDVSLNLEHGYSVVPRSSITDLIPADSLRQYLEVELKDPLPPTSWFDMKANNYGFMSYYDYPYKKKENDFVVGIWGGSVAFWMSIMGKDSLIKYLQKHFKQKNIVILNFAQGGMKQPQSLSILSYFHSIGQKFDAAIFLDGVNEIWYAERHDIINWAISAPSSDYVKELYTLANQQWSPEYLVLFYNAIRSKGQQLYFESRQTNFASVFLIQEAIAMYYARKYDINKEQLYKYKGQVDNLIFLPPRLPQEKERVFETATEIWKNATIAANSIISSDKNSIFVHAIQPNRFFPINFSNNACTPSLNYQSPIHFQKNADNAKNGYPYLIQASEDLRNDYGINSIDLTELFNEDRCGIFADYHSHFTKKGNDIVAKLLADTIIILHKAKSSSQ